MVENKIAESGQFTVKNDSLFQLSSGTCNLYLNIPLKQFGKNINFSSIKVQAKVNYETISANSYTNYLDLTYYNKDGQAEYPYSSDGTTKEFNNKYAEINKTIEYNTWKNWIRKSSSLNTDVLSIGLNFRFNDFEVAFTVEEFQVTFNYNYNFTYNIFSGESETRNFTSDSLIQEIKTEDFALTPSLKNSYNFLGYGDQSSQLVINQDYVPGENYTFSKDDERILVARYSDKNIYSENFLNFEQLISIFPGKTNDFVLTHNSNRAYEYTFYSSTFGEVSCDPIISITSNGITTTDDDSAGNRHFTLTKRLLNQNDTLSISASVYNNSINKGLYYLNISKREIEKILTIIGATGSAETHNIIEDDSNYSYTLTEPKVNKKYTLAFNVDGTTNAESYDREFINWQGSDGNSYSVGSKFTKLNDDLTLEGNWNTSYETTIKQDNPTKAGYSFYGWSDKKTGKIYEKGDTITLTADTTLIATWTEKKSLIFSCDGATDNIPKNITDADEGQVVRINSPISKSILSIYDKFNGSVIQEQERTFKINRWKVSNGNDIYVENQDYIEYTVTEDTVTTFSCEWSTIQLNESDLPVPTRDHYIFKGWSFTDDHTLIDFPCNIDLNTRNIYACWHYVEDDNIPIKFLMGNSNTLDYLENQKNIEDGVFYFTKDNPNLYLGNRNLVNGEVNLVNNTEKRPISSEQINILSESDNSKNSFNEFLIRFFSNEINNQDLQLILQKYIETNQTIGIPSFFYNCQNITRVIIPPELNKFASNLFINCTNIKYLQTDDLDVVDDNSAENIEQLVFTTPKTDNFDLSIIRTKFKNLKYLDLSQNSKITKITDHLFENMKTLEEVKLGNNITSIDDSAFSKCSALKKINFPSSLTTLKFGAFFQCGFKKIILPETITTIDGAFNQCERLEEIEIQGNISSISQYCFYYCKVLKKVMFPNTVKNIGYKAFNDCINLTELDFTNFNNIPILDTPDSVFENCDENFIIKVPRRMLNNWKDQWPYYADRIRGV